YGNEFTGFIGKLRLSRILKKKDFCGVILLQNAFEAALIASLAGIKERIGYDRDGREFLLTKSIPVPDNEKQIHQINYYLNLLSQTGIEVEYSEPYIYLSLDERLSGREILKGLGRPILGINPGATYGSAKRWFPERFSEISNWFIKDTKGSVVIFAGKNEVDIAEEIDKNIPENKLLLAGRTSLRELISLISECDVFVTNDSGPMHIAYAVRTPLVAIFGSTDPALTGPAGSGNAVLTSGLSCSPCFDRTCKTNDMRCMYAITPDDVYHSIKRMLPDMPAVFFDRDGTLCRDAGYLRRYEDLHIFEDINYVKSLKEKGFKIIGVTNQSGVAKGIVDEEFVKEINNKFVREYGFDDFYYCPHSPEEHCPCRKPEPEMLLRARISHKVDFKRSYMVGDKETDMLLAKSVGAKGILVKTGEARESINADHIAEGLKEAVDFIMRDSSDRY
ncbi:MAG: lipopolysaccharide heptosyltransferase II, partial [Nitrospirota bacterium]